MHRDFPQEMLGKFMVIEEERTGEMALRSLKEGRETPAKEEDLS